MLVHTCMHVRVCPLYFTAVDNLVQNLRTLDCCLLQVTGILVRNPDVIENFDGDSSCFFAFLNFLLV